MVAHWMLHEPHSLFSSVPKVFFFFAAFLYFHFFFLLFLLILFCFCCLIAVAEQPALACSVGASMSVETEFDGGVRDRRRRCGFASLLDDGILTHPIGAWLFIFFRCVFFYSCFLLSSSFRGRETESFSVRITTLLWCFTFLFFFIVVYCCCAPLFFHFCIRPERQERRKKKRQNERDMAGASYRKWNGSDV